MPIAHIALDVPLDTLFEYMAVGAQAEDVGRLALVPFGRGRRVGVIVGFAETPTVEAGRLKPVTRVLRELPALPADILELARFCATYYHHPLGQVLATLLPQRLRRMPPARAEEPVWRLSSAGRAVEPGSLPQRAVRRRRLLAILKERGELSAEALRAVFPGAGRVMQEFLALGWVERGTATPRVEAPATPYPLETPPVLNPDQEAAVAAVCAAGEGFSAWLLLGVTGSGKTEVYSRLIAHTLAKGRQSLVLVPEINLTPQTEARFRRRFPQATIISLHSHLAEGERLKRWRLAQEAKADIVLGTRLAVFTPLPRLGLIVVDEEHDISFKQQEGLRYSARDLAVYRARQRGVPIVLGSATPSLESWHNACLNRYHLLRLPRRAVEGARPPRLGLIDIRREALTEGLSARLILALKERLRRGEQSLLFLNRRGFAPVLHCSACGWLAGCPRCAVKLVVHLADRRLRCHHCGHEEAIPRHCPDCGALELNPLGQGTQRVEQALRRLLPEARLLRIDRDSTRRRAALPDMLEKVAAGEVDILLGTQMLTKGHDFPRLTLVGILNADGGLYSADFRASERLFAQLLQVAGRAGRASADGEVLIQTSLPGHPLFAALAQGDYEAFATTLAAEREALHLPPFSFQAWLRAEAHSMEAVMAFLRAARACARPEGVTLYDPVPAPLARKAGKARAQLLVEADSRSALQAFLGPWLASLNALRARQVRWALDVDPVEP
jgi:primosomal protein N' (replication factor Y)